MWGWAKLCLLSLDLAYCFTVFSSGSVIGSIIYSYITFREKDPPSAQGATTSSDGKQQVSIVWQWRIIQSHIGYYYLHTHKLMYSCRGGIFTLIFSESICQIYILKYIWSHINIVAHHDSTLSWKTTNYPICCTLFKLLIHGTPWKSSVHYC